MSLLTDAIAVRRKLKACERAASTWSVMKDTYRSDLVERERKRLLEIQARLVETQIIDAHPHGRQDLAKGVDCCDRCYLNESALSFSDRLGLGWSRRPDVLARADETRLFKKWVISLRDGGAVGRQEAVIWRGKEAARDAAANGWFMVFQTLTLDSNAHPNAVEVLTSGWRRYNERLARKVASACYGSYRAAPACRAEYFQYLATIEFGEETGRVHLHAVYYLRDIPAAWKRDPNAGLHVPYRREIGGMKSLWSYGWSAPIAVRYGPNDAWARAGWRWPTCKDRSGPLEFTSPDAIVGYCGKYITKQTKESRSWKWRTRVSRGLGMRRLNLALRSMETRHLGALMTSYASTKTVPLALLRRSVLNERLRRLSLRSRPHSTLSARLDTGMTICRLVFANTPLDIFGRLRLSAGLALRLLNDSRICWVARPSTFAAFPSEVRLLRALRALEERMLVPSEKIMFGGSFTKTEVRNGTLR